MWIITYYIFRTCVTKMVQTKNRTNGRLDGVSCRYGGEVAPGVAFAFNVTVSLTMFLNPVGRRSSQ